MQQQQQGFACSCQPQYTWLNGTCIGECKLATYMHSEPAVDESAVNGSCTCGVGSSAGVQQQQSYTCASQPVHVVRWSMCR